MEDLFEKYKGSSIEKVFKICNEDDEKIGFPVLKFDERRFRFSDNEHVTNIYGLIDPRKPFSIRYIGKANCLKKRLKGHLDVFDKNKDGSFVDTTRRANWIRKLLREEIEPNIVLIAWVSNREWRRIETEFISLFLKEGFDLTNDSPGGEGGPMSESAKKKLKKSLRIYFDNNPGIRAGENSSLWGFVPSKEQRENMSKLMKGRFVGEKNWTFGSTFVWINNGTINERHDPDEQIRKGWKIGFLTNHKIGKDNYWFGKSRSKEQKEKQSKKMKGRYSGEKNPVYGVRYRWITNGFDNNRWSLDKEIKIGFYLGFTKRK